MEKELAERIALFRFGVIAPLVDRHLSRGERERILGEITGAVWQIPGSARSAVARSTVLKWMAAYRNSGGDIRSLEPRPRSDRVGYPGFLPSTALSRQQPRWRASGAP